MNSFFWKNQSRLSKNGQKNKTDPVKKNHVVGILATTAVASTAGGAAGAGVAGAHALGNRCQPARGSYG
jgi:hypothetical protein